MIWWKTEVIPASTPDWRDVGVRQEVVEAWRMIEARKAAQKKAEDIRAQVEGKKRVNEALKLLRQYAKDNASWGNLIHLDNVARKVVKADTQEKFSKEYEAYKVPRDEISYPPENFVDQVLELGEGQAKVLSDRA